jgi:hypothetical protein
MTGLRLFGAGSWPRDEAVGAGGGTRTHTTLPSRDFKNPKSMTILLKVLSHFCFTFAVV